MTRTITICKAESDERWDLPADLDCLDAVREMLPVWKRWGFEIAEPRSAAPITIKKEYRSMSVRKQIVEFAKSYTGGEVPVAKADVLHALEATATKRGMSLSKFAEAAEGSALYRLYKNAPGSDVPARPIFKTSYQALQWEAAEHCRKANVPVEGSRDDENTQIGPQMDKTVRAVAQSLVDAGKFDSVETAHRYMKTSSRYAHLFKVPGLFAEGRRDMLSARR